MRLERLRRFLVLLNLMPMHTSQVYIMNVPGLAEDASARASMYKGNGLIGIS